MPHCTASASQSASSAAAREEALQQRLLLLEPIVGAALAVRRPLLSFAPELEAQFEADSATQRLARFRLLGLIAIIILNLFNLTDPIMLPDIAAEALRIRLGIVTPVMVATIAAMYIPRVGQWREWLLALLILLAGGSLIYFFTRSHHPNALQYHSGVILIVMFGSIVIRQRFWFALGANLLLFFIYCAAIAGLAQMLPEVRFNSGMVLFSAVVISLIANYQMEYDSRRTYLQTLLQRIEAIKLQRSRDELELQAKSDPLTGLANRRYFDSRLNSEWLRAQRGQEPLSLIYFDVDFFKAYNDHYGHQAGDECLIRIARAIQQSVQRAADLCARYGGEEFIVLLPQTSLGSALAVAEKLRASVEATRIRHQYSEVTDHVTVSCGVACMIPESGAGSAKLIEAADRALYAAKSAGRNRISGFADTAILPVG